MSERDDGSVKERLARLEARVEHTMWWRNPGWWGVILSPVSSLAWQIKPWEVFHDDPPATVKLIDGHASAFAKNEWNAELRVVNGTSRDVVVERVAATFGASTESRGCREGRAVRELYPVEQLRSESPTKSFQRIHPEEGAPFTGGPNIDRVFGARRPSPLAVGTLRSEDTVTFTVFTSDGKEWKSRQRLFYEPRARVGGGGAPCVPPLLFLIC